MSDQRDIHVPSLKISQKGNHGKEHLPAYEASTSYFCSSSISTYQ
jgi:hypothetical protein